MSLKRDTHYGLTQATRSALRFGEAASSVAISRTSDIPHPLTKQPRRERNAAEED
jgi:hypothetical protein